MIKFATRGACSCSPDYYVYIVHVTCIYMYMYNVYVQAIIGTMKGSICTCLLGRDTCLALLCHGLYRWFALVYDLNAASWAASVFQLVEHTIRMHEVWVRIPPECSFFFGKSCLRSCVASSFFWMFWVHVHEKGHGVARQVTPGQLWAC